MEPPRRNPAPWSEHSGSPSSSPASWSPSDSSTASMASSTASLLSLELDDWLFPLPASSRKDAGKSLLWPPTDHGGHQMALVDALLLSDVGGGGSSSGWLGDDLHYEPDNEPSTPLPVETTHAAEKTTGGGCGMAGKCGGGAQFADMEALLAAGGCCRGEAGASSCCRVAKPLPLEVTPQKNVAIQSGSKPVQTPTMPFHLPNTALPSPNAPSPLACGCSDGNCSSSSSSDANLTLKPMSKEGNGGSSDSTASSSSSISVRHRRSNANKTAASADGKDKQAAPRTRKRRSNLTPEERAAVRREQHRETMRRSRQRFRDRIDAMKETVERLETVKANALAALELSAYVSESGSNSNDATPDDAVLRDQLEYLEREEQQLVREKRELHAQVVQSLLEIVASHPSNFRATTSANRELVLIRNDAIASGDASTASSIMNDGLTLCDFVTWDVATIGHCLALVRDSYAEISHFYASIGGHDGYSTAGYDTFAHTSGGRHHPSSYSSNLFRSGLELMGWRDHRRFRGDSSSDTCLEFAFEKVVPAADARELFVKTWLFCRDQQSFASMFAPAVTALELEVLHEIHDDLVVVRRMQQEEEEDVGQPGAATASKKTIKFRSIDLLYRIDAMDEGDDDGWSYVIFRSINPSFVQSCGCAGNAWFDSYMWFGFAPVRHGVGGSRVRFGGTLDGHSRAFALRWMLAIFFVLLRWESANVAPLLIVS